MNQTAQDARDVVTRFISAFEQRRAEAFPAMLTDDVVHVTAFSAQGGLDPAERYVGREAVLAHFADVFRLFGNIRLERTGLFVAEDGATAFFEAIGDNVMADTGQSYRNRYLFKFVLKGGRVAEFTEFFNPVTFALMTGQPVG